MPRLLQIAVWREYVREASNGSHSDGQWMVSAPAWDKKQGVLLPNRRRPHSHYRHPQVLVFDWGEARVEIIGAHLKSAYTGLTVPAPESGEDREAYLDRPALREVLTAGHVARIKLTTEATDIRYYIDKRFAQTREPLIFLVGDLNDGPGKELLEREYLLHDLIGNLQGSVFEADKFLNHALFDYKDSLRWTAEFRDALDPDRSRFLLLDHIMFTQGVSGPEAKPLRVPPRGGLVEHEIHDRINALLPKGVSTSDHRPVSVRIEAT